MHDSVYAMIRPLAAYSTVARLISTAILLALAILLKRRYRERFIALFAFSQSLLLVHHVILLGAGRLQSGAAHLAVVTLYAAGLTLSILAGAGGILWCATRVTQHAGGYRRGPGESSA